MGDNADEMMRTVLDCRRRRAQDRDMVLLRLLPVGLVLFFLGACNSSESGPSSLPVGNSGQTGSIGQAECTEDVICKASLVERLQEFESPAGYWPKADSGVCGEWAMNEGTKEIQGLACECYTAGNADPTTLVGPRGLTCSNYGRRLDCIYEGAEFPGCEPTDAASCTAVCVDVAARYEANARMTWKTEVLLARCENLHCYSVYRIGDNCYAQTPNTNQPLATVYDCNLSPESILAQARK